MNLFSKYDTYSIALVADDKAGIENINFNTITMSDGTVVEINKFITIEVLKEQASISNVIIENVANNIGQIRVAFSIKDVDDTIIHIGFHLNIFIRYIFLRQFTCQNINFSSTD